MPSPSKKLSTILISKNHPLQIHKRHLLAELKKACHPSGRCDRVTIWRIDLKETYTMCWELRKNCNYIFEIFERRSWSKGILRHSFHTFKVKTNRNNSNSWNVPAIWQFHPHISQMKYSIRQADRCNDIDWTSFGPSAK